MSKSRCCIACGEQFTPTGQYDRRRCLNCYKEHKLARARARDRLIRRTAFPLTVLDDPLQPGGFSQGTHFDQTAVESMIQHGAFTPGTVVRDNSGAQYRYDPDGRRFLSVSVVTSL
jgi:hypothetical protein